MKKRLHIFIAVLSLVLFLPQITVLASEEITDQKIYKPYFVVSDTIPYRVYAEKQSTWKVLLNNPSRFSAHKVNIKPDIAKSDNPGVRIIANKMSPFNIQVTAGTSKEFELNIIVDDSVKEGIYPIYLTAEYENNGGKAFSQPIVAYYEVRKDNSKLEKIAVEKTNFDKVTVERANEFDLNYSIKNNEKYSIKNLQTTIEGLPKEYFTLVSADKRFDNGNLKPGISLSARFRFYANEKTPAGNYEYSVVYEYDNESNQRIVRKEKYNLFVPFKGVRKNQLAYTNIAFPKAVAQDATFKVSFDITNRGETDIDNLYIKQDENPVFFPKSASLAKWSVLKAGETKRFSISLTASGDNLVDRNYPLQYSITYGEGEAKVTDTQIIGVYVNAKENNKESKKNTPKLIISKYVINPTIVKAGTEFTVDLSFLNTNKTKTIYNVKAFLTFAVNTGKDAVNDNVFSPVGSSNTFYIDKIAPNQVSNQTLRMFTVPDAAPKTYTVTVNFEYEDGDGNPITATELVGIPVAQPTKIETSAVSGPTSVEANEEFGLNFNIFNTGKSKVYNLLIKTVGDFKAEPSNQYIGNFDSGSNNKYDGYITLDKPGEQELKFLITYDDQTGEHFEIEKVHKVTVQEAFLPEPDMNDKPADMEMPENKGKGHWLYILLGLLAVGVITVIIIIVLKKRKHKREMNSYEDK